MGRHPSPRWHAGNGQWVSDVGEPYTDRQGRRRRRTVAFAPGLGRHEDRKARRALDAWLDAQATREEEQADPTVEALAQLYLEWLEVNREPATFRTVAALLSKFAAWPFGPGPGGGEFGARRASTLRPEDLEALLAEMSTRYAPSYCAVMHAAVQAMLNWSARRVRGRKPPVLIAANPLAGVAKPRVGRAPERYASRDELADFLRWLWRHGGRGDRDGIEARFNRQLCLLLRLLAHTGARPGELTSSERSAPSAGFTWDRWYPDAFKNALGQRVGLIQHEKHKTSKKTGRPREIVVPPTLTRALERHRVHPWTHPAWVFTHRRGNGADARGYHTAEHGEPWTSLGLGQKLLRLRRRAIAAGVKVRDEGPNRMTPYVLRHSKATDLVQGGLTHDQAAALLGTSGHLISTTYAHTIGSRLAALDDVARARRKPTK